MIAAFLLILLVWNLYYAVRDAREGLWPTLFTGIAVGTLSMALLDEVLR